MDGGSPATEPTRAEVVAGTGAGGSTPLARGTVVVSNESYVDSVVTTVIGVTSAGLGAVSSAGRGGVLGVRRDRPWGRRFLFRER